jgi:hypothetical protein
MMSWTSKGFGVAVLMCGFLVLAPAGCRSRCDLVEAELRTKERQLRELQEEACRTELFNEALQNELRILRPQSHAAVSPEHASQVYTLKEIALGRTTGGRDDDGHPGDEALQVLIEPRDPDGHAIKAPGSVRVDAAQISPEGIKTPLCYWELTPSQLRRTWRSGLFANGYDLILPWKVGPSSTKVRVTARMTIADGRMFEADKDVTIRLAQGVWPNPEVPCFPDVDGTVVPTQPITPLPAPRSVSPEQGPELQPATSTSSWSASWRRDVEIPAAVRLHRPEPQR